tara:strand:- start:1030 stop:1218 length:189 start_codon:yes stop_codon:yes gene_type:complete
MSIKTIGSEVYSFSAKDGDIAFVEELKLECQRKGKKFSWVILEALKQYDSNLKKAELNGNRS